MQSWDLVIKYTTLTFGDPSNVLLRAWANGSTIKTYFSCNHGSCATASHMRHLCTIPGFKTDDGSHSRYFFSETRTGPCELSTSCVTGGCLTQYYLPEGCGPFPTLLTVAGSGPTDRDGNSSDGHGVDTLKLLANALAERGIASLRYDKGDVAGSLRAAPAQERDLSFDMYVDDAERWVKGASSRCSRQGPVDRGPQRGSSARQQATSDVASQQLAYTDPSLPLVPDVVDHCADLILESAAP